jgi:ferredoxin
MTVKVEFKKSDKSAQWDDRFESILDLAEEQGMEIENDCRQGI